MTSDKPNEFLAKLKRFWQPINIYNNLRQLYFSIIPKGSKAYDLTYGFLRVFLKQLQLFNIYYKEWIRRFDQLTEEDLQEIQETIQAMKSHPTISVVMPVYNPPADLLDQAIKSVINQVYPHWELCIADDVSTDPQVISLLESYQQEDNRIRVVFRKENGHISAASNSAIELVNNAYFALLDHDDLLHPLALYYVAKTIEKHPDSVIIYSDEDKITKKGRRLDPYFKPDFNYELFLSQNMISHLGVYKTQVVRQVGGFRVGLEGSQDYDLALRVLDQCKPEQIYHIPIPLYHWRIIKASAAKDLNIKPYAITSAQRALGDHLLRRNINAEVTFLPDVAAYSVSYSLNNPPPSVSIVIPVGELSGQIFTNVKNILKKTEYPEFQIVLGLRDKEHQDFEKIFEDWTPKARFIQYQDNYSSQASKINDLINATTSDFICVLDGTLTGYDPGWLAKLTALASQPQIGAVAPRLINQSGRVYSNGIILLPEKIFQHLSQGEEQDLNGYFGWSKLMRGYSALSDKCLLFKKSLFTTINGFDETFQLPIFCGADFCLRLREQGCRNILHPAVALFIEGSNNRIDGLEDSNPAFQSDKQIFTERWYDWIVNDPAFNPNLFFTEAGKLLVNTTANPDFFGD